MSKGTSKKIYVTGGKCNNGEFHYVVRLVKEVLEELIKGRRVSPTQKAVIAQKLYHRYTNDALSLDEVAYLLGISRSRVSLIEQQGLRKIEKYVKLKNIDLSIEEVEE